MPAVRNESHTLLKFLIWALCISQGLVYIVCTPLWEGWDEAFHYSYIQTLVESRTLPVFGRTIVSKEITSSFEFAPLSYAANLNVDSRFTTFEEYWKLPEAERREREARLRAIPNDEKKALPAAGLQFQNYEAHQAPLYYLAAAPVYALLSSYDLLTRVFALRLFSLLLGSLTIPIAFAIVRYAGSTRHVKLVPLLLVLLPLVYPTIARIANDSLAVMLFSALVWLVLRYFNRWCTTLDAVGVGVVLGLGLLAKAYFLTALPALALIFLLACFTDRPRGRLLVHAGLIALLAGVLAGGWYARNYRLYGNVSGMQEVTLTSNVSLADRIKEVPRVEWSSSLKAMFKEHIWTGNTSFLSLSRTTYNVGYALILLAILGTVKSFAFWLFLSKDESHPDPVRRNLGIVAIFYVIFLVGVLYHMLVNFMFIGIPNGTGGWYLYAVIVPELILLVHGLESLAGKRAALATNVVLVAYLLVANLVSLFCKTLPSYGGFFIPRFHFSHFLELYSRSGLKVMLGNLAVNKPLFVGPETVAVTIGVFLLLLLTTLVHVSSGERG